MQDDMRRFRLLAAKQVTTEQPISGGTNFVQDSLEGHVLEETDEERKDRLQREKETNEYSAVEDGVGEVILSRANSFLGDESNENGFIPSSKT